MRNPSLLAPLAAGLVATPALAGTVSVQIPRVDVAEYHRPYVAIWLEPAAGGSPRTLAVWYDAKHRGEPGTKWLSELRGWWRVAGRAMAVLPEGLSGATRAPGQYAIPLPADLKPGAYTLKVEAARETGGRELVSVPITLPRGGGRAAGHGELGAVAVALP
ncbi:MAG TPA: DUF2271 domain-containing protein [Novosphingobium sp.]|nr:DUF2271 domain-containing protein [Novosphingobium sp.]